MKLDYIMCFFFHVCHGENGKVCRVAIVLDFCPKSMVKQEDVTNFNCICIELYLYLIVSVSMLVHRTMKSLTIKMAQR